MNINTYTILVTLALIFAVLSMVVPRYPFLAVAVLLLCVASLVNPK